MSLVEIMPLLARSLVLVLFLFTTACAGGGDMTRCPDDSEVEGSECHLAPDGTYYGDGAEIPEDVTDDVADRIDEEADEESGIERVEVTDIEIGGD
jgi:hypothetical protein